jgi:hypothetical protein
MIDTDKYKGHTPSPWRVEGELTEGDDGWGQSGDSTLSIHGDGLYIGQIGADYGIHETHMNALLIADAPKLLTEIKRLQERLERLDWILGDEELVGYICDKEVAYMDFEGVRLPWISADEWGEEE